MTKQEFKSMLIKNDISYIKIVRIPDLKGGHQPIAMLNDEARNYELKDEFERVEFNGNVDIAVFYYNIIFESLYYFKGTRSVYYPSLSQLVEEKIYGYE